LAQHVYQPLGLQRGLLALQLLTFRLLAVAVEEQQQAQQIADQVLALVDI
jgi:hypothetical protein